MLDRTILEFALKGLEAERQRIESEIENVRQQLARGKRGRTKSATKSGKKAAAKKAASNKEAAAKKRKPMSAAKRKAISERMKRSWAKKKAKKKG